MSKRIIRAVVALALTATFLSRSELDLPPQLTGPYTTDWDLVKDIIVTQPQVQTDTLFGTTGRLAAAVAINMTSDLGLNIINALSCRIFDLTISIADTGLQITNALSGYTIFEKSILCSFSSEEDKKTIQAEHLSDDEYKAKLFALFPHYIAGIIPTRNIIATASFILLRKRALRVAEIEQLKKVTQSWPELRAKFPPLLHELFDKLHTLSTNEAESKEYLSLLPKTVRLTKEAIDSHFKDRGFLNKLLN